MARSGNHPDTGGESGAKLSGPLRWLQRGALDVGFDSRGKENFFGGSGRCSALTDYHLALRFHLQRFH